MYESFFNLRAKPFSLLPDPGFLYLSQAHQEALTILEYGLLNQAGFIVLTGEIGVGKTTLMRCLLERLDDDFTVGLISNTHQSVDDWMEWVCSSFSIKPENRTGVGLYDAFVHFVIDQYAKGKRTLLIVDEAQNLSSESLEQLRLLSNINSNNDLVFQLMLLGQPQLRDLLRQPELQQFVQRVAASYHLGRLDAADTERYIRHRIAFAGGHDSIFTADACATVFAYSKGVPRLINLVCDTALIYAYAAGSTSVTADIVDEFVEAQAGHLLIPLERTKEPGPARRTQRNSEPAGLERPGGMLGSQGTVAAVTPAPIPDGAPKHSPPVAAAATPSGSPNNTAVVDGDRVDPPIRSGLSSAGSPLAASLISAHALSAGLGASAARAEGDVQDTPQSDLNAERSPAPEGSVAGDVVPPTSIAEALVVEGRGELPLRWLAHCPPLCFSHLSIQVVRQTLRRDLVR